MVVSDARQPKVSLFLRFDATKFVLLSVFTLSEIICPNICSISRGPRVQKSTSGLTRVAQKRSCLTSLLPNFQRRRTRYGSVHYEIINTRLTPILLSL